MDKETVITHLQIIHTWAEFARERDLQFFTAKHLEDIAQWSDDAIALLKEQKEDIDNLNGTVSNLLQQIEDIGNKPQIVRCKDCRYNAYIECGFPTNTKFSMPTFRQTGWTIKPIYIIGIGKRT